jgi:hypothetical protein
VSRAGTEYTGTVFHGKKEPLTHTDYDGDAYSDVGSWTEISPGDWSTAIPTAAKALHISMACADSGSVSDTTCCVKLASYSTATNPALECWVGGLPNGVSQSNAGVVPTTDGKIYIKVDASGSSTMQIWLLCVGYEL